MRRFQCSHIILPAGVLESNEGQTGMGVRQTGVVTNLRENSQALHSQITELMYGISDAPEASLQT